jgi:hypothetical protein
MKLPPKDLIETQSAGIVFKNSAYASMGRQKV